MSISAMSGSTASSAYSYDHSTSKRNSSKDDPMMQAISQLQDTDPTLATKFKDMTSKVESMKKSGASEKDIQSTIKQTMDGLSSTEKSELKSAMPEPPKRGHGGKPPAGGQPPALGTADTAISSDNDTTFSLSSLLDSVSSSQNDAIANFMTNRLSSSVSVA